MQRGGTTTVSLSSYIPSNFWFISLLFCHYLFWSWQQSTLVSSEGFMTMLKLNWQKVKIENLLNLYFFDGIFFQHVQIYFDCLRWQSKNSFTQHHYRITLLPNYILNNKFPFILLHPLANFVFRIVLVPSPGSS